MLLRSTFKINVFVQTVSDPAQKVAPLLHPCSFFFFFKVKLCHISQLAVFTLRHPQ